MKKLVIALVLAMASMSPALAQSYNSGYGTGNIVPNPSLPSQPFEYQPTPQSSGPEINGYGTYAQEPEFEGRIVRHSRNHTER